jgi:hypothetical protein
VCDVLWCAGAYVSGAAGSNECPAGSVRIETEAACRTAAAAAGKTFQYVETYSRYPRGCYYNTYNMAYFNLHAGGAGASGNQLLCAALATTGAPHAAPMRRRMYTGACSCIPACAVWHCMSGTDTVPMEYCTGLAGSAPCRSCAARGIGVEVSRRDTWAMHRTTRPHRCGLGHRTHRGGYSEYSQGVGFARRARIRPIALPAVAAARSGRLRWALHDNLAVGSVWDDPGTQGYPMVLTPCIGRSGNKRQYT